MPEAAGADGGPRPDGGTVRVRPPEEVIQLAPTVSITKYDRPKRKKSDTKGKGKGKGIGGRGKPELEEPTMLKDKQLAKKSAKFVRDAGAPIRLKAKDDKKLNAQLKEVHKRNSDAVYYLAKSEVLQTEEAGFLQPEGRERTWRISQDQILEGASVGVAKKCFSFDLPYGPYVSNFTSNGQHFFAAGRKGHVCMMHCDTMQIATELQLKETTRAVQPLHNHLMFAVAQKKYLYFYDNQGIELHCVKEHRYPHHLEYLPYHFLLASACEFGNLHYRDVSTGAEVAVQKTKLGSPSCLRQNSRNAVLHMGHANGTVTMWTPTVKNPIVKLWCQAGQVNSLAIHGNYMATAGAEGYWKVWDLRKYEAVSVYKSYGQAVSDIDISMTGLLAVGFGAHVEVWKGIFDKGRPDRPYLTEMYPGKVVSSVRFRPYEDVLAVGHSAGFGSLIAPGAGHANIDSFEANPFETRKERREKEVRSLLEKLQPDSIMLDPTRIGSIDKKIVKEFTDAQKKKEEAAAAQKIKKLKEKKKARGKMKIGRVQKRKELMKGRKKRDGIKDRNTGEGSSSDEDDDDGQGAIVSEEEAPGDASRGKAPEGPRPSGALGRFYGKRRRKT